MPSGDSQPAKYEQNRRSEGSVSCARRGYRAALYGKKKKQTPTPQKKSPQRTKKKKKKKKTKIKSKRTEENLKKKKKKKTPNSKKKKKKKLQPHNQTTPPLSIILYPSGEGKEIMLPLVRQALRGYFRILRGAFSNYIHYKSVCSSNS